MRLRGDRHHAAAQCLPDRHRQPLNLAYLIVASSSRSSSSIPYGQFDGGSVSGATFPGQPVP